VRITFTFHASRFTIHVSRLTFHVSRLEIVSGGGGNGGGSLGFSAGAGAGLSATGVAAGFSVDAVTTDGVTGLGGELGGAGLSAGIATAG